MGRGTNKGGVFAAEALRDRFAFAMIIAFIIQMYTVPGEWIAWAAPLRIALVTSGLAAGALLVRRLGKGEAIALDGTRGWALLCLLGLAFLSRRWSVSPENTQTWAMDLLKLVAIYFTTINVVTTPKRLYLACATLVLASIVTAIGTMHWYHVGQDLVEGFRARWVGVFADPNHLAEDIGIVIPIAVAFFARKATGGWLRFLCVVAAGLAVVAMVETHSRGGSIGLVSALGVWALREKEKTKALLVGSALLVGLVLFAPKSFWNREQTVGDFQEDASAMGRVYAWNVASKISVDRPLLGVGGGGFRYAWPLYAPIEAKKAYVAHNIYLDTIGELGFVGLFFFLVFTGGATAGAFEGSRDEELGWLARGISAAVVGYLVCNLFSGDTMSAYLYVLLGLSSCCGRIALERARRKAGAPEPLANPTPAPALGG